MRNCQGNTGVQDVEKVIIVQNRKNRRELQREES